VHRAISGPGPFTLFLMVDSAFANLTQEQVKLVWLVLAKGVGGGGLISLPFNTPTLQFP